MPEANVTDTLLLLAKRNPARVLEAYYWSEEHDLLEFIRGFLRLPHETQEALKLLFASSAGPISVQAMLTQPTSLPKARNIAKSVVNACATTSQTASRRPCAAG
jgi:hypothetical protein